jgi:hypothetical protein
LRYGTSYFTSTPAAFRYYKRHGGFSKDIVERKFACGEIHIGKPPLKAGQRLVLIDKGIRYAIETTESSNASIHS